MTITLQALFDANTDKVQAAAQAWTAMADALDDACENLIKGTQDLEYQWPDGQAAEAAHAKNRETRNEASNAVPPCRVIGRALREYADTIRSLQHHLANITAEAARAGYQVDIGAGTVAAPQHLYQQSSAPHVIAQAVNGYMHQLQSLIDQAADVDRRTAATLNANLPNPQTGFGSLSAPKVTLQQIEAMKGKPAAEVNQWWNGLTAEQQDQIVREFPHLIGNIDGVPADDRNTANRSWIDQKRQALRAEWDSIQNQLRTLDPLSDEAAQATALGRAAGEGQPRRHPRRPHQGRRPRHAARRRRIRRRQSHHRRRQPRHRPAHRRLGTGPVHRCQLQQRQRRPHVVAARRRRPTHPDGGRRRHRVLARLRRPRTRLRRL